VDIDNFTSLRYSVFVDYVFIFALTAAVQAYEKHNELHLASSNTIHAAGSFLLFASIQISLEPVNKLAMCGVATPIEIPVSMKCVACGI
jgi:hypothetical protein